MRATPESQWVRRGLAVAVAVALVSAGVVGIAAPALAVACVTASSSAGGYTTVTVAATSTCTWAVPTGVYSLTALVVGGGGGGGGGTLSQGGSGGGGGEVMSVAATTVAPADVFTMVVGAGGAGGSTAGTNGADGSNSTLEIAGTTTTARGGKKGVSATYTAGGAPVGGASGNTNSGGTATSPSSTYDNAGGGGGDSAASTGRNGGSGTSWNGVSYGGGGGGGSFYATATSSGNAQGLGSDGGGNGGYVDGPPTNYGQLCSYAGTTGRGGGGGGASVGYLGTSCAGSSGGDGVIKIRYQTPSTVTFNADGGSGSMTAQQANIAQNLTANTFTNSGYTFAGWATTSGGSVAYADGAQYDFTAGGTTLYAVWTANSSGGSSGGGSSTPAVTPTATITFESRTVDCTTTAQTVNVGAAVTTPGTSWCEAEDVTLTGWNTEVFGTGTAYGLDQSFALADDMTLWAQWQPARTVFEPKIPVTPARPRPGSRGSGVVLPPPPLPSYLSQTPKGQITAGPVRVSERPPVLGVDVAEYAKASPGAKIVSSSVRIWSGLGWVKEFRDPKVGTWQVRGTQITFTPVDSFRRAASTTYRVRDTKGALAQAGIAFKVVKGGR